MYMPYNDICLVHRLGALFSLGSAKYVESMKYVLFTASGRYIIFKLKSYVQ